jgi:hypothetical protein
VNADKYDYGVYVAFPVSGHNETETGIVWRKLAKLLVQVYRYLYNFLTVGD